LCAPGLEVDVEGQSVCALHAYMYESIPKMPLSVGCLCIGIRKDSYKCLNL